MSHLLYFIAEMEIAYSNVFHERATYRRAWSRPPRDLTCPIHKENLKWGFGSLEDSE